ncbi:MAG: NAD(P)/FAD-dependent oxidoreductase [Christensenellaceae bacterium]|nr:NAD(P)/FAD-dependent oxidoreductase [Christensenellaceae bacterium]
MTLYCDTAVIGGGPAGMAAALAAKKAGADTILLETSPQLGGILNQCIHNGFGLHIFGEELTGPEYADRFKKEIENSGVRVYTGTLVTSITKEKKVTAFNAKDGMIEIEAKSVVFSLGCRERPRGALAIAGTRPAGVYTAGTAQYFVNIEGKMPGRECVILGSGDIGLIMARRMTFEGAKVKAVVELMPYSGGLARNIKQCLDDFDIPLLLSHTVVEIHGENRVTGVTIAKVGSDRKPIKGTEQFISCDCLLLSVGLIPLIDLAQEAGAELKNGRLLVGENFMTTIPGLFACGNALHVHDLVDFVTKESSEAGLAAANYALGKAEPAKEYIELIPGNGISYIIPQRIAKNCREKVTLRFRSADVYKKGSLVLSDADGILAKSRFAAMAPGEMQSKVITAEDIGKAKDFLRLAIAENEL